MRRCQADDCNREVGYNPHWHLAHGFCCRECQEKTMPILRAYLRQYEYCGFEIWHGSAEVKLRMDPKYDPRLDLKLTDENFAICSEKLELRKYKNKRSMDFHVIEEL